MEEEIKPTLIVPNTQYKILHSPFLEHAAEQSDTPKLLQNAAKLEMAHVLTALVTSESNKQGRISMETKPSLGVTELDVVPTYLSHNQQEIVFSVLNKWTKTNENQKNTNIFQKVVSDVIGSQRQQIFSTSSSENNETSMLVGERVEHRGDNEAASLQTESQVSSWTHSTEINLREIANSNHNQGDTTDLISFDDETPTPAVDQYQQHTEQFHDIQGGHICVDSSTPNRNQDVLDISDTSIDSYTQTSSTASQLSLIGPMIFENDEYTSAPEQLNGQVRKSNVQSSFIFSSTTESNPGFQQEQQIEVKQTSNMPSIPSISSQHMNASTGDKTREKVSHFNEDDAMEQVTMRRKPNGTSTTTDTSKLTKHPAFSAGFSQVDDLVVMRSKDKKEQYFRDKTTQPTGSMSINNRRPETMIDTPRSTTDTTRLSDMRKSFTIDKSLPPLRQLSALRPLSASMSDLSRFDGEPTGRPASASFATSTFSNRVPKIDYPKAREIDGRPFQVDVLKGIVGIGLKVKVTPKGQVEITDIQRGGPVEKNGHVRVGDFILFVNSTELTGQTDARVQQILRLLPRGLTKLVISCSAPASRTDSRLSLPGSNWSNARHWQPSPVEIQQTHRSSNNHSHGLESERESDKSAVNNGPPINYIPSSRSLIESATSNTIESNTTNTQEVVRDSQIQSPNQHSVTVIERPKPAPRHTYVSKDNNKKTVAENTSIKRLDDFVDSKPLNTVAGNTSIKRLDDFVDSKPLNTVAGNTSIKRLDDFVDSKPVKTERHTVKLTTNQEVNTRVTHSQDFESRKDKLVPHSAVRITSAVVSKPATERPSSVVELINNTDQHSIQTVPQPSTTRFNPPIHGFDKNEAERVSLKVNSKRDATFKNEREFDAVSTGISETKEATITNTNKADTMFPRTINTNESTIRKGQSGNVNSTLTTISASATSTHQPNPTKQLEETVTRNEQSNAKPQRKISSGYERFQSIIGAKKSSSIIETSGTFVSSTARLFNQKTTASDDTAQEHAGRTRRKSESATVNLERSRNLNPPMKSIQERWKSTENVALVKELKQLEPSYLRSRSISYAPGKTSSTTPMERSRKVSESVLTSTHMNSALSPRKTSFEIPRSPIQIVQTKHFQFNKYNLPAEEFTDRNKETFGLTEVSQTPQTELTKTEHPSTYKSSISIVSNKRTAYSLSADRDKRLQSVISVEQNDKPHTFSVQSSIHSRGGTEANHEDIDTTTKSLDESPKDSSYQRSRTHPQDVTNSLSTAESASLRNINTTNRIDFELVNDARKLPEFVITVGIQQGKPKHSSLQVIKSNDSWKEKEVLNKEIQNETTKTTEMKGKETFFSKQDIGSKDDSLSDLTTYSVNFHSVNSHSVNPHSVNSHSVNSSSHKNVFSGKNSIDNASSNLIGHCTGDTDYQQNRILNQDYKTKQTVSGILKNNNDIIQRDNRPKYSLEPDTFASSENDPPALPSLPPPSLASSDTNLLVNVHDQQNLHQPPFSAHSVTRSVTEKQESNLSKRPSAFRTIQLKVDVHAGELLVADDPSVTTDNQTSSGDYTDSVYADVDIFNERDNMQAISPSPVDMLSEDSGMPADDDQEVATDDAISPPGELADNAAGTDTSNRLLTHSDIETGLLSIDNKTQQSSTLAVKQDVSSEPVSEITHPGVPFLHEGDTFKDSSEAITENEDLPPPVLPSSLPPNVVSVNSSDIFIDDLLSDEPPSKGQIIELQPLLREANLHERNDSFKEKQEVTQKILANTITLKVGSKTQERYESNINTITENVDSSNIKADVSRPVVSGVNSKIPLTPASIPDSAIASMDLSYDTRNPNTDLKIAATETRNEIITRNEPVVECSESALKERLNLIAELPTSTTASETLPKVINTPIKSIQSLTHTADSRLHIQHQNSVESLPDNSKVSETHVRKTYSEIRLNETPSQTEYSKTPSQTEYSKTPSKTEVSKVSSETHVIKTPSSFQSEIREKSETKYNTKSESGDLPHIPDSAFRNREISHTTDSTHTAITSKRRWCLRSNICQSPVLIGYCDVPAFPTYTEGVLLKALPYTDLANSIDKANATLDSISPEANLFLTVLHLHGDGAPLGVDLKHEGGAVFRVSGIKKGSLVLEEGGAVVGDRLVAVDSLWCDRVTVMRFLSRLSKPKHDSILVLAREEKAGDATAAIGHGPTVTTTQNRPAANDKHDLKLSEQDHSFFLETTHTSFVSDRKPTNLQDQPPIRDLKQESQLSDETPPRLALSSLHQGPQLQDLTAQYPESHVPEKEQSLLDQLPITQDNNSRSNREQHMELDTSFLSLKQSSLLDKSLKAEKNESILILSDKIQTKQNQAELYHNVSQKHTKSDLSQASVSNSRTVAAASARLSEVTATRSTKPSTGFHEPVQANDADSPGDLGPGVHKVVITKGATGVGFCLEGGVGSPKGDLPIIIKRIFKGGPAEKCGLLRVKDEILEVNGLKFSQMGHYEAWNHLKFLNDGEIDITIRRN